LAEDFARVFGAGPWGREAGLKHDLGKYSNAFQEYLLSASTPDPQKADFVPKTDHSTAGAQHAVESDPILGHLLAYVIAGHHSGLLDGRSDGACQEARLSKAVQPWKGNAPVSQTAESLVLPEFLKRAFSLQDRDPFAIALFVRMVFSCLADADFLDTERFMDPERSALRPSWPPDILSQMEDALSTHVDGLRSERTSVDRARAQVRQACIEAARKEPGLFSLTVPTGGGKTLSSLAFALRHAVKHGLERVIYVIPFTSIIEQNADVFRCVFLPFIERGLPDPVLEHHCNVDEGEESTASRLSAQNWNAPLVVTTSVQFYDSLFANRSSKCRKLHNLASAVIILDEVQSLPVDLLRPCLHVLRLLARDYGSTVVLCTATQPAIHRREDFPIGLEGVREIMPNPPLLYGALRRVSVQDIGRQTDRALAERMLQEHQALCVVNTRAHAKALFHELGPDEGHFHLSALMCPEHRKGTIETIKKRLEERQHCRVVSTQLVEAGVDIDFPVVFRALAGLDSIAQAAGRCNRNGLNPNMGTTFVFRPEHSSAERFVAETANVASQVLPLHADPLAIEAVEHYFRLYYWDQSSRWDARHILDDFHMTADRGFPFAFQFASCAERFHIIDDSGRAVIVPWMEQGKTLCEELRRVPVPTPAKLLRMLQRFTVQIPSRSWLHHVGSDIQLVHDRYPVLVSPELHYDPDTGLALEANDGRVFFC
jgi:CRISPR-associated endonuclease/helicase Cas3